MQTKLMKMAASALLVMAAAGCAKQETAPPAAGTPAEAPPQTAARAVATGRDFLGGWHVCAVEEGVGHGSHMPPLADAYLELIELSNGSGQYAFRFKNTAVWKPGWRALALSKTGTNDADMPYETWEAAAGCKPGQRTGAGKEFKADLDTVRLRGGTCLPDGTPYHDTGTCSNDDPAKNRYHYHEVVIFAHAKASESDVPHLLLQYCSRDELNNSDLGKGVQCPRPHHATPAGGGNGDDVGGKNPHPGHVHLEGF